MLNFQSLKFVAIDRDYCRILRGRTQFC